jgi:hypothetical protein
VVSLLTKDPDPAETEAFLQTAKGNPASALGSSGTGPERAGP